MKKIFLIYFLFAFFGIASCKKNENFNIDKLPKGKNFGFFKRLYQIHKSL